jgi:dTDP-4-dehydrorhamnose reductase
MKIVVFGARGMLGKDLMEALHKVSGFEVSGYGREVEITDSESIKRVLLAKQPNVVINCAGYTDVDGAEGDAENAMQTNGYALQGLSEACNAVGAHLMHISTDYVFDGEKAEGYRESDKRNPLSVYGKSKLMGEELIEKYCESYSIIRTSWLFGNHGKNFVDTIRELLDEKDEIKVVNDQTGSPTYTKDLAGAMAELIRGDKAHGKNIYHITNGGTCTWFDFAVEIARIMKSDCSVLPCSTGEFPRPAKRPKISVLFSQKDFRMRSWEDALADYIARSFDIN